MCEEELGAHKLRVKTASLDPKPQSSGSEAEGKALGTALWPPWAGWFGFVDETSVGKQSELLVCTAKVLLGIL